jgi:hypothetical protein
VCRLALRILNGLSNQFCATREPSGDGWHKECRGAPSPSTLSTRLALRYTAVVTRELTPEARQRVGLPPIDERPYPWAFMMLVAATAATPLLIAGLWKLAGAIALVALGVRPAIRAHEQREAKRRERIFLEGRDAVGRVLDVEPGGDAGRDRTVRIEFQVGDKTIRASVFGCGLVRQGLAPVDEILVRYAPDEPQRCLVVERIRRAEVEGQSPSLPPSTG